MTEAEARADLKAKVREKLEGLVEYGMAKLDTLDQVGAGIVQDHMANDCNYKIPMTFLAAFGVEVRDQFAPTRPTQDDLDAIKNYQILM